MLINPLPDNKFLDSSKLKEFAYNNFKLDENGSNLSKQVENIVGKGETARYEQFLLFPQCFQKARFPGGCQMVSCGNGLKLGLCVKRLNILTEPHLPSIFVHLLKALIERQIMPDRIFPSRRSILEVWKVIQNPLINVFDRKHFTRWVF